MKVVDLPSAEELSENDLGDVAALDPVFAALVGAPVDQIVFVDVGANNDGRLAEAAAAVALEEQIAAADRATALIIPYLCNVDAVLAAARTIKRFQIALPSCVIVPCRGIDGGDRDVLNAGPTKSAMRLIASLEADTNHMILPRMRPRALQIQEALRLSPAAMASIDCAKVATIMQVTTSEIYSVRAQFKVQIARVHAEAVRVLKFPDF
ncbi:hypothetical protein GCM10007989_39000 [Devosia pacifica]|uniref:Uncharacterized protein n=1 Tax=Devosia pacifica TaxID=1335967 RepID=A0A918SHJ6_9HYPH|nr:hypothetical protein [Devosia pacifica]GHA39510.1 hypothetical protein GCM10007989_39000 [Devosia pacifica]